MTLGKWEDKTVMDKKSMNLWKVLTQKHKVKQELQMTIGSLSGFLEIGGVVCRLKRS